MVKNITIKNPTGLHARPASLLAKEAGNYDSDIYLISGDKKANCKSIMGIMALGVKKDDEVRLVVEGNDEIEAMNAIAALFEEGFGE